MQNDPWCPNCQKSFTSDEVDEIVGACNRKKLKDLWAKLDALRIKEGWTQSIFRAEPADQTQVQPTTTEPSTS